MGYTEENHICDGVINLTNPYWAERWLYTDVDTLIYTVIQPSLSSFGLVGNAAFLFTILRLPVMRTTLNAYLANLAVCDFFFLVFQTSWGLAAINTTPVNRSYPVTSALGCMLWTISMRLWYFASLGLMSLISIERFFAICYPVKHRLMNGKARNLKVLCAVWTLSLAITLTSLPRFMNHTRYCLMWPKTPEYLGFPLTVDICRAVDHFTKSGLYEGLLYLILFMLAMIGNTILYVKIIMALHSRNARQDVPSTRQFHGVDKVRNQVARTLIANGIIFFICQMPYRFYSLDDIIDDLSDYDLLQTKPKSTTLIVGRLFLTLNAVINPYLFVLSSRHYRRAMLNAFGIKLGLVTPLQESTMSTEQ